MVGVVKRTSVLDIRHAESPQPYLQVECQPDTTWWINSFFVDPLFDYTIDFRLVGD
jgi:hypothetical protein